MKNNSILFLVGAVIVVGAIGYAVTHKTAPSEMRKGDEAAEVEDSTSPEAKEGTPSEGVDDAMEVGGVTAAMPAPGSNVPEMVVSNDAVTIDVTGKNFAFDKEVVRVKEGQTVKIVFTSENGFHDWVVDGFSARTAQVTTGNTSEVTFVADKKGTFEYYCSVGAHRANGMHGQLIVE
jgi:plastocyanin